MRGHQPRSVRPEVVVAQDEVIDPPMQGLTHDVEEANEFVAIGDDSRVVVIGAHEVGQPHFVANFRVNMRMEATRRPRR